LPAGAGPFYSPSVRSILILALLAGCASTQTPRLLPPPSAPETRDLPPDPAEEPLPDGIPAGETVEPLEAGSCYDATGLRGGNYPCPRASGLLASEGWAVRAGFYRLRYRELREHYEADRSVWRAHRVLYESTHAENLRRMEAARPSWLVRNAFPIGLGAGLILGGVAATSVAAALR